MPYNWCDLASFPGSPPLVRAVKKRILRRRVQGEEPGSEGLDVTCVQLAATAGVRVWDRLTTLVF